MELKGQGLELQLVPIGQSDNHGFMRARLTIAVPSFAGQYETSIERRDFVQFATELENLDAGLRPGDTATLQPVEHEFSLLLTMGTAGQIGGAYRFQGACSDGVQHTVLTGSFSMDQSYLPKLRREVASMLDGFGERELP